MFVLVCVRKKNEWRVLYSSDVRAKTGQSWGPRRYIQKGYETLGTAYFKQNKGAWPSNGKNAKLTAACGLVTGWGLIKVKLMRPIGRLPNDIRSRRPLFRWLRRVSPGRSLLEPAPFTARLPWRHRASWRMRSTPTADALCLSRARNSRQPSIFWGNSGAKPAAWMLQHVEGAQEAFAKDPRYKEQAQTAVTPRWR